MQPAPSQFRSRDSRFGTAVALAAYSAALTLALAATLPWWARELRRGGKYREGLPERLGRVPIRLRAPAKQNLWLHAVSVGEVLAAAPLVTRLREALPGSTVYISTTTRTGQALARARFGADTVFFFPADFAFAVRSWLRFLHPSLLILVESEVWPRLLYECARARIPVAVVNARISPRSWPRYRRLRALWRPFLGTLALVHAQSDEDAARLGALGVRRVEVGGNLKYDLPAPPATPLVRALADALPGGCPVLVCGSTLAGEEALLLGALPADAVLILAPRHPERFGEVAALLAAGARPWARLSLWRSRPQAVAPGTVLLLDSLGELAAVYSLGTLAIVGGAFLHTGGHNPLEPASLGVPVVIGRRAVNFAEVVGMLVGASAVRLADATELRGAVRDLLAHPEEAAAMGARGKAVCGQNSGATGSALAALLALLETADA